MFFFLFINLSFIPLFLFNLMSSRNFHLKSGVFNTLIHFGMNADTNRKAKNCELLAFPVLT